MDNQLLEVYWSELPTGKENAVTYPILCVMWGRDARTIRSILHELSSFDNGDDFVLIRSSKSKGFYKTNDEDEIRAYRKECLNKGRSIFAPIKKCNRILNNSADQFGFFNNLRVMRESREMKQTEVCRIMKESDPAFDASLLSKMENSVCMPTFKQLAQLAHIYGCMPSELICMDLSMKDIIEAVTPLASGERG